MKQENIRNVAIIAHVDHGKTTLVDRLLYTSGVFRENQQVEERVLDSNDQERERGITILSKNISVRYKDVKINVIDTPGHADFGGEVERVLNMADGALLIVDAFEGPMPQTRFVLRHALSLGLRIVLVINKIDRPGARPEEVVDEVFDLMVELEASDEQLDFPIIYASAVNGYARYAPEDENMNMIPLLETILKEVPAPDCEPNGPVALQICTVDHSSFVGRIGVGRLFSGTIHKNEPVLVIKNDGTRYNTAIKEVFTFEELGKKKQLEVHAGDIVAVVGVDDADIGDMVTSREHPVRLDPIEAGHPVIARRNGTLDRTLRMNRRQRQRQPKGKQPFFHHLIVFFGRGNRLPTVPFHAARRTLGTESSVPHGRTRLLATKYKTNNRLRHAPESE